MQVKETENEEQVVISSPESPQKFQMKHRKESLLQDTTVLKVLPLLLVKAKRGNCVLRADTER